MCSTCSGSLSRRKARVSTQMGMELDSISANRYVKALAETLKCFLNLRSEPLSSLRWMHKFSFQLFKATQTMDSRKGRITTQVHRLRQARTRYSTSTPTSNRMKRTPGASSTNHFRVQIRVGNSSANPQVSKRSTSLW